MPNSKIGIGDVAHLVATSRPAWPRVLAALALLLAAALLSAPPASGQSPSKVALVVGNAAYAHAPPLANPKNDAEDIAAILEGLGFAVEKATDLDYRAFTERVLQFSKRAKGAEAALFYYAGHGLQVGGVNYLLPVDVALEDEMQLRFQTVDLNAVLQGMRSSANLVFLDACRDNPFVRSVARSMGTRSSAVGRGLARVEKDRDSHGGTFIAFATAAGELASDGEGRNSPFTAALKKHIGTPGLVISQIMNRVRRELASMDQEPWATSSLVDDFYFSPSPSTALPTPSSTVPGASRLDPAEELWSQIKASNDAGQFEQFMHTFPNSPLAHSARARLDVLRGQPFTVATLPAGAAVHLLDHAEAYRPGMVLPPGDYRVEVSALGYETAWRTVRHGGSQPTNQRIVLDSSGRPFRDCADCPEMVVVPAGRFRMGDLAGVGDANERPVREVRIARDFALGRHEVTVGQFRQFALATGHHTDAERDSDRGCWTMEIPTRSKLDWTAGRSWRSLEYQIEDDQPVACVSWRDAQAYVGWLSERAGKPYRLPSESEWEYAARARSETKYHFGNDEARLCAYGNVADETKLPTGNMWNNKVPCSDGAVYPVRVGSYQANDFGLHDMHGNVWEWVQDCWNGNYQGAPRDGSAWESSDCSRRVLRGGSWNTILTSLRSAFRLMSSSRHRSNGSGFRVARTLTP